MGGLLHDERAPAGGPPARPPSAPTWRAWLEPSQLFIGILDPDGRFLMANAAALAAA